VEKYDDRTLMDIVPGVDDITALVRVIRLVAVKWCGSRVR